MNNKMKCGIASAIVVVAAAAAGLTAGLSRLGNEETVHLYIDGDDDVDSLWNKMKSVGNPSAFAFHADAMVLGVKGDLRPGHYEVSPEQSVLKLLHRIRNHNEDPVRLVVPSVRTMPEMAGRLAEQLMVDSATIAQMLDDSSVVKNLGYTKETIPCLFVPNTYEVYWDILPDALMQRLVRENKAFWNDERTAKLAEVSRYAGEEMSKEKVVTLASIVDSETANNAEKPIIAALYMNRMRIGMPLQSDPTVKYALQDFSLRRIMHKHLDVQSPYNTYRNQGLPPGPICVPSIAGIDAVLNHAHNDYIYMCAKEDFSGTHNYAVSYAEHQRNAARYAKALNERNIY